MSELDRYLLTSEVCVATVRRHWAMLVSQGVAVVLTWIAWLWVLSASGGLSASTSSLLSTVATFFFVFSFLWIAWLVVEWYIEMFAVTDRRVLLVTGLFYKRVAVMPLQKVTDLTYERSPLGRLLGYGTFVVESAGQDQALSRIDYIPNPDRLYFQLSEELFGRERKNARRGAGPAAGPMGEAGPSPLGSTATADNTAPIPRVQ